MAVDPTAPPPGQTPPPSPPQHFKRLDAFLGVLEKRWHTSLKDSILTTVVVGATIFLLIKAFDGTANQAILMVLSGLVGSITTMLTGHAGSQYGSPYGGMSGYGASSYGMGMDPTGGMGSPYGSSLGGYGSPVGMPPSSYPPFSGGMAASTTIMPPPAAPPLATPPGGGVPAMPPPAPGVPPPVP